MNAMKTQFLLLLVLLIANSSLATHNRAGEIQYVQLSDVRIRATVITYTKASSVSADRDSLLIDWGDGSFSSVLRTNGDGELLGNNTKRNIYIAEHTYPGRGTYTIGVMDPNRVENILNIDPPNSVNIPFFIQTTATLLNMQFQAPNRSVRLLQAPIDFACVGVPFQHNPAAYDEDGDSLAFELTVPLMDKSSYVPNYSFPNQVSPGPENVISLDRTKGTFRWNSPQKAGEYNLAFIVHEYRKGVKVASTIRDMQIFVRQDCGNNQPPSIIAIDDTCIIAGTVLVLPIEAYDPDTSALGSKVLLTASGAPFFSTPPMIFDAPSGFRAGPVRASLRWETHCGMVRKEFYTVVIKVTDNLLDSTGVSVLHAIRIKVVAPAPEQLQSSALPEAIHLTWDYPYPCDVPNAHFRGFSIWRKEGSLSLLPDTCLPGLERSAYQRIAYLVNDLQAGSYFYDDSVLDEGKFYCYRVQAEFADISSAGFLINVTGSLPSNETCNSLPIGIPVLLNADVVSTDSLKGSVFIRWTKPLVQFYDTAAHRPPYETRIHYLEPGSNWQIITESIRTYSDYGDIADTSFLHINLQTSIQAYVYTASILSGNQVEKHSDTAESLFLKMAPDDRRIVLRWNALTPWNNYQYAIFLKHPRTQTFDSIALVSGNSYTLTGLENGEEYCAYVLAFGDYGIDRFPSPLLNRSNVACSTPSDLTPPCCPKLEVEDPCMQKPDPGSDVPENVLRWNNPNLNCEETDAAGYRLYAYIHGERQLVADIGDPSITRYDHRLDDITPDCYELRSYDSSLNECANPDTVCVEYCPIYKLPNTFTPNGDGTNDRFKSYPYLFIERVDFKIFNRWGNLLFKTQDPDILWEGKTSGGENVPDGTYYYTCRIYYAGIANTGRFPSELTGFIELRRGSSK